jgi:hypothetical protein
MSSFPSDRPESVLRIIERLSVNFCKQSFLFDSFLAKNVPFWGYSFLNANETGRCDAFIDAYMGSQSADAAFGAASRHSCSSHRLCGVETRRRL